ncbi:sigma-70 family RNA polymerase sigma factor [Flavobacteriaceae bacterium S356]|uniref:Sigma-70 family RNA polymerase sigma factor n=1 Tax=Asprobacillus argus TaxID=3076534 RepID=A0ABU3LCS5_9FLAO|nr:sigma-70 family RNA polymerase sigma factor [Flavobacteriaceae bacterium S356]
MKSSNQSQTVEHIFRHEYGKIVAILVHKFGAQSLEKIEDAVQNAFLKAMQIWGYKEVPKNPTAWLLRVASNGLIDVLRREKKVQKHDEIHTLLSGLSEDEKEVSLDTTVDDSQLKMIFACCNPSLPNESQLILSLKLIGGFSNKEISKALLKKEEAVAKSFTRAKKKFKESIKTLDIPIEMGLSSRINSVLKVLYLLFTEGYTASEGTVIIKRDICYEAIRLALLLTENKTTNISEVHALIALMCFHTSRFDARIDTNNELVDLEHQDRTLYNKELIQIGMRHLYQAKERRSSNPSYYLQAAISYYYCEAPSFEKIDWESVLLLYDLHLKYANSPLVQLNRIIPLYKVYGPKIGLETLVSMNREQKLNENALFYSIKAEMLKELDKFSEAKNALEKAIDLTKNEFQKKHLIRKLQKLR